MSRPLLVVLLAFAGCHVDLNDPGTEPLSNQFYFPSGAIVDPGNKYLYVSNGNADLNYGGGTVQIVDLDRFDAAVAQFRAGDASGDAAGCTYDPLDPMVVDCDETPFILAGDTVKVGNFAGNMQLQDKGGDTRRLFVGVRGDPSITWIDTDVGAAAPSNGHRLDCFDHPEQVKTGGSPPGCDGSHLVQDYFCQGQPNCMMGTTDTPGKQTIPPEPFGMHLDQGMLAKGAPYTRLLVSHLLGGQVMLIDATGTPTVQYLSNPFFAEDSQHRHGAFALAPQHPGDPASTWYMTSNIQAVISTFRVADVGVVVPSLSFAINGVFASGSDVRGIVFEPGGNRAFVSQNNPPSLMVLDTRPQPGPAMPGTPYNQVVDVIDACQEPSNLALRRVTVPGAPGTPDRTQSLVYMVCFLASQVMVIDPDAAVVKNIVLVGRGPNTLAFREGAKPTGFITNYSESTIGEIDLDPSSPTANRMVARIGIPVPPKVQ
jgi:hypothetical protein